MGHEVTRSFSADGTRTYSYSIDGTHYYMTDLVTGEVTITPETYGEIIEGDIVHFVYEGQESYLAIGIDEDLDAIVMDGLDENANVLDAYIYRSTPWTTTAEDINGNDVMTVLAADFDTVINNTFNSAYLGGAFAFDEVDHTQNGETVLVVGGTENGSAETVYTGITEWYTYTERTYDSVMAEAAEAAAAAVTADPEAV